jgi:7-cyano-7-deazaguanine reductase
VGTIADSPLGKAAAYADGHDPALLFPVERAPQRAALGLGAALPFAGHDDWTAWEASWLDADGRPRVGVARFSVPCISARLVESKSVKLYLTALNNVRFASSQAYMTTLARDLSAATGSDVAVTVLPPERFGVLARGEPAGESIDAEPLGAIAGAPDAALLTASGAATSESLHTRLFRSVCPVTGQPDYATVEIAYRGPRVDRAALLAYLLSFRRHEGFHEHCVERMFVDIQRACRPAALAIRARFTRRGGIDINPLRSNDPALAPAAAPTLVQ